MWPLDFAAVAVVIFSLLWLFGRLIIKEQKRDRRFDFDPKVANQYQIVVGPETFPPPPHAQ
jgi:hypothetical protein